MTSTSLAAETWLQCVDRLDSSDLASLCSACRSFQGLCQPLLFANLRFRVQKGRNMAEHARLSTIRLEQLATSRHVACVRSWSFGLRHGGRHIPYPQLAQTYSAAIDVFRSTLSVYHNLRSLTIHGLAVDEQLRQTIASLPLLADLALWDSIVLARTGSLLPLRSFQLSVSAFGSSETTAPNQPLHLISLEPLVSLTIDGSSEANAFLRTLMQQGTAKQLSSLTVTLSDTIIDTFTQFMERCPSLTELSVTGGLVLMYTPSRLPPSAVPSLQKYTGPHIFAESLASAHALTSVNLLGVYTMQGILLSSIQSLLPTLRTLSVELHVSRIRETMALIAGRFDALEDLRLVVLAVDPDHVDADTPPQERMARLLPVVSVDDISASPFIEILPHLHPTEAEASLPPSLQTLRITASWMANSRSLGFPMQVQRRILGGLHLSLAPESLRHILLGGPDEEVATECGVWVRQQWRGGVPVWRDMCTGEEIQVKDADVREVDG